MRVIAVLLAVLMILGTGAQVSHAFAEVASMCDDAPDPNPPVVSVTVIEPPRGGSMAEGLATPAQASGRSHAVFVFRPPRPLASR